MGTEARTYVTTGKKLQNETRRQRPASLHRTIIVTRSHLQLQGRSAEVFETHNHKNVYGVGQSLLRDTKNGCWAGRHLPRDLRNTGEGRRLDLLPSIAHKGFLSFPDRITGLSKAWSDKTEEAE